MRPKTRFRQVVSEKSTIKKTCSKNAHVNNNSTIAVVPGVSLYILGAAQASVLREKTVQSTKNAFTKKKDQKIQLTFKSDNTAM